MRSKALWVAAASACLASLPGAARSELSGTQHRIVGSGFSSSVAAPPATGATRNGGAVGQPEALGFSGAGLTTHAAGFWPIVASPFPNLDLDSDGVPSYVDLDDDGDGLLDVVETGTGIFVDANDTGSDPYDADTDGDGTPDGPEVAAGRDPNLPDAVAVPALGLPAALGLGLLLGLLGLRRSATGRPLSTTRGKR